MDVRPFLWSNAVAALMPANYHLVHDGIAVTLATSGNYEKYLWIY